MKSGYTIPLAVAGIAACVAVFAVNEMGRPTDLYQAFSQEDAEFLKFVNEFGKSYGTAAEYQFRSEQFKNKLAQIVEHNSQDGLTYELGINQFSDWTQEEYERLLGTDPTLKTSYNVQELVGDAAPIDWRAQGKVNPVKDQKQCGSCWAFSAVSSVESAYAIESGKLLSLSEQQLVDCSKEGGNAGCNGGLMDNAFTHFETHPADLEADYPYTARTALQCKETSYKGQVTVKSFVDVKANSQEQLALALQKQPVSVAIQANQRAFQLYKGGIFNDRCGTNLDHGVVAVGYGVENGTEYFIVRNSWGASWGEQGYIRIARNDAIPEGICGIAMQASYPVV